MIPVHYENEKPIYVKLNSHLNKEEFKKYKTLVMEYWNITFSYYKNLKNILPKIVQHTIPLIYGTKPICKNNKKLN
jgi:hypothetical protein